MGRQNPTHICQNPSLQLRVEVTYLSMFPHTSRHRATRHQTKGHRLRLFCPFCHHRGPRDNKPGDETPSLGLPQPPEKKHRATIATTSRTEELRKAEFEGERLANKAREGKKRENRCARLNVRCRDLRRCEDTEERAKRKCARLS